jgi:hypothetical protein
MKFDTPAGANPIDQLKVVGRATDRIGCRWARPCGVAAAIANAVYNATGVRGYPITLDKLLDRLPTVT